MDILSHEALAQALERRLGLAPEEALAKAEQLLDIFGFETQVIDNVLEPEDRQVFYELQSAGLVSTRSEETQILSGQEWRTHYWLLRTERVQLARTLPGVAPGKSPEEAPGIYAGLPDAAWSRR